MLHKIIIPALLATCLTYGSATTQNAYSKITTTELQKKVEHLSQIGKLPFEMGLELIRRWTASSKK